MFKKQRCILKVLNKIYAEYDNFAIGYKSENMYDSFKDKKELTALGALLNVVQKDSKNIKGFYVDKEEGLKEISKESIDAGMSKL